MRLILAAISCLLLFSMAIAEEQTAADKMMETIQNGTLMSSLTVNGAYNISIDVGFPRSDIFDGITRLKLDKDKTYIVAVIEIETTKGNDRATR
ncbi:TPA_asm: hypothetical protein vir530_00011 [dsDNA virus vir530]|jgi:hypothetical protein|nr:TPA_asm: hypothetical protein vir530_00011 [dsDNA virus vir530]